ncbi:hypothetical protein Tco_0872230 [Tanacetum coccineum]
MPRARPSLASLLRVPNLRCDNRRCHNQRLVFEAIDKRQIGEVFSMSSREIVYKFVSMDPKSRSTPFKFRGVFPKSDFKNRVTKFSNRKQVMSKSFDIVYPRDDYISQLIVIIPHYLYNLFISESNISQKFTNEAHELRAIPCHMFRASRVQIPENNLDNLSLKREEENGTSVALDPNK